MARALCFLCLVAVMALGSTTAGDDADIKTQACFRRPAALVLSDDDRWLFVANERSGSVSAIDTASHHVVAETRIGRKITDLATVPHRTELLAVDGDAGELIVLRRQGMHLNVAARISVAPAPVSVQAATGGSCCFVASLWSRRLSIIDFVSGDPCRGRLAHSVALPFAPRKQLLVPGTNMLIVADGFGGKLAVVDAAKGELHHVHELPAHNIRGLAVYNGRLLLTHQRLSASAVTDFDDVHWGNLITNNLRLLRLEALNRSGANLLSGGDLYYLGDIGHAAGDPAGLSVTSSGTIVVALAGVDEIAIRAEKATGWKRLKIGQRPTAMTVTRDGNRAYVANTNSDSISVIDLAQARAANEISLGAGPEATAADRGERLFYSSRLSHDGWLSCHSCHTDGHTNGQLNDNLSDGSFGTPKRVLTLRGVRDTAPYAWLGTMPDLESQLRKSIQVTMQGQKPNESDVHDLAAFLRTLPAAPPVAAATSPESVALTRQGQAVFRAQGCINCHAPPTYTSPKSYDVGLKDEAGNSRFNPPSLRGLSQGGPYFHDNRAATLEEVFSRYRHELKGELSSEDFRALLAFLQSL
jgi:YVTN family beta-propeller protein